MGGSVSAAQIYDSQSSTKYEVPSSIKLRRSSTSGTEVTRSLSSKRNSFSEIGSLPSLPIIRTSFQRQRDVDYCSNLLSRNFQILERLNNDKMKRCYPEFLVRCWIAGKAANGNSSEKGMTETGAFPRLEAFTTAPMSLLNVQQEFDQIITDLFQNNVLMDEVCSTIFAGYDLLVKSDDGLQKVMLLTQLKTRETAGSFTMKPGKGKEDITILNPFIAVEQVRDWLLLAFWPIFVENEHVISPFLAPVKESSLSFFRRNSTKVFPHDHQSLQLSKSEKERTAVVPFEPIKDEDHNRTSQKGSKSQLPPLNALSSRSEHEKPSSPATSSTSESYQSSKSCKDVSASGKTKELNLIDSKRKDSLLSYSEVVSANMKKSQLEFTNYVRSGKWWSSSTFFSNLEHTNVAISIHSVEKNGTYFPFVYVNQTWEMVTGYHRDEVFGLEFKILEGKQTERSQADQLQVAMKNGLCIKIGINLQRSDKMTHTYHLVSMIPVYDSQENYKYLVVKLFDVQSSTATVQDLKYAEEVMYLIGLSLRCL